MIIIHIRFLAKLLTKDKNLSTVIKFFIYKCSLKI